MEDLEPSQKIQELEGDIEDIRRMVADFLERERLRQRKRRYDRLVDGLFVMTLFLLAIWR